MSAAQVVRVLSPEESLRVAIHNAFDRVRSISRDVERAERRLETGRYRGERICQWHEIRRLEGIKTDRTADVVRLERQYLETFGKEWWQS
jgi:hypothetical protein